MSQDSTGRLFQRVQHTVSIGTVSAAAQESAGMQTMQTQAFNGAQTIPDTTHVQHYGFASSPLPGCRTVGISLQGNKASTVVVATNDPRYRPMNNFSTGDTQLHDTSQAVHLVNADHIDIIAANSVNISVGGVVVCTMTKDGVTFNVPVSVTGTITATQDITGNGISLDQHVHTGVQSGSSNTGTPER